MKDGIRVFKYYENFADVFNYPNESLRKIVINNQNLLEENYPEAAEEFIHFTNFSKSTEIHEWEEIYTRSFDVQALTTLDLGYVLFGDDYKRGELLVKLSKEHNKVNNLYYNELADHLPNVLRLLGKLKDEDLIADIISLILQPALTKIASEFQTKHIEKKTKIYQKHHRTIIEQNKTYFLIYQYPIRVLLMMIKKDFKNGILDVSSGHDFTNQISSELEIENLG